MKRTLTVTLALLTMLALTAVVHADVISDSGNVSGYYYVRWYLPWVLVAAVVVIAVFLLQKFWKKKK